MASARDFLGTTAINAKAVGDKPRDCKIIGVGPETLGSGEPKLCLELDGFPDQKLALNKTNLKRMIKAFGDDFTKWKGKSITLKVETVQYMGDDTDGVRLYPKGK